MAYKVSTDRGFTARVRCALDTIDRIARMRLGAAAGATAAAGTELSTAGWLRGICPEATPLG